MHDFAHLEFIRNATRWKYAGLTPVDFIFGQVMNLHPVNLPIWLIGLYYFFFSKQGKSFRVLGIIYLTAFLVLVISRHSKAEYLSPAYPMLIAAGAVQIETLSQRKHLTWLRHALPAVIIIGGMITAPLALPCLPVKTYIRYTKTVGFAPESPEGKELSELPQFYADMFGWENLAETVSNVYTSLPQQEKSKAVILAQNYGEAGAIEYYSRKYELPQAVSPHNNYWIWGHGDEDWQTVVAIGGKKESYLSYFEEVDQAAIVRCRYCMPYENNLPVFICRNLKRPLEEIWSSRKSFN